MLDIGKFPILGDVIDRIGRRSAFQRKHLSAYMETQDEAFALWAESTLRGLVDYCRSRGMDLDEMVNAYIRICMDTLTEEIRFSKTGRYSLGSSEEALSSVYSQADVMRYYMYGLALSQVFWLNHYRIFRFFQEIVGRSSGLETYLEIGPGHGLFLLESLRSGIARRYTTLDLSQTSIDITRSFVDYFDPAAAQVDYVHADIYAWRVSQRYDFIVAGEVLEHVDDPAGLLTRLGELLAPAGRIFITTCANCPAIDHVYLFESADEIRALMLDCGFVIESELALKRERAGGGHQPATVNYAALIAKDA